MWAWAPLVTLTDWLTTDEIWRRLKLRESSRLGLAAISIAESEIGKGEEGGNNKGPHLRKYRRGREGGAWCAAFASWCIVEAAQRSGRISPIEWTQGARQLLRRTVAAGWMVDDADVMPGDIVAWARGQTAWQGHVGIVSRVERDCSGGVIRWHYISGNEGRYPSKVREHEGTHKARRIGFARLP